MTNAIFIDRDGTLLDEPATETIDTWDKFKIRDNISSLSKLQNAGYKLFIITNQEGINEGKLDKSFYDATNDKLLAALQKNSIRIEKIYTCHHAIAENCACRKPKTKLVDEAVNDFQINRERSWVIGDRISDIKLAFASGMRSVFVKSEFHKIEGVKPDFVADDLNKAVKYILKNL